MGNNASTNAKALRTQRLFGCCCDGAECPKSSGADINDAISEESADLGVEPATVRELLRECAVGRGDMTPLDDQAASSDTADVVVVGQTAACLMEETRPFEWRVRPVTARSSEADVAEASVSHALTDVTVRATAAACSLAEPPAVLAIGDHVAVACATAHGRGAVEHHGVVVATEPALLLVHSFGPTVDRAVVQLGTWAQFCFGAAVSTALVYRTISPTDGAAAAAAFTRQEVRARACALLGTAGLHDVVRFNCEHVARFATTGVAFSLQQLTVWQCLQQVLAAEAAAAAPADTAATSHPAPTPQQRRELGAGFRPGRAAVYPPLLGGVYPPHESAPPQVGSVRVAAAWVAGVGESRPHTSPEALGHLARELVARPLFDASGLEAERWFLASPTVRRALVGRRPAAAVATDDEPLAPPTAAVPAVAIAASAAGSHVDDGIMRRHGARRALAACLAWAGAPTTTTSTDHHAVDDPITARAFEEWAAPVAVSTGAEATVACVLARVKSTSDTLDTRQCSGGAITIPAVVDDCGAPVFSATCTRALQAVPPHARVVLLQFDGSVPSAMAEAPRHVPSAVAAGHGESVWRVAAIARPEPRFGVEAGRHVLGFQWRGHWLSAEIGIAHKPDDGVLGFADEFGTGGASVAVMVRVVSPY